MRYSALVSGGLLLFGTVVFSHAKAEAAKATFKDAKGATVGSATLTEGSGGVTIAVEASKLPPGSHGFHIHEAGKCDPPDFKSAKGHFNPTGKKHGLQNPEGPHAGDLPNLEVGADGTAKAEVVAAGVTLKNGKNSLFQRGGTALVIHAGPDDEKSDPSGNSGARIACGVIRK